MTPLEYFYFFLDKIKTTLYNKQALFKSNDPLAQLAEHLTFNQRVRSSSLRWITKKAGNFGYLLS